MALLLPRYLTPADRNRTRTFRSLPVHADTRRALASVLKYEFATKVQKDSLPPILNGHDVLAKAKTVSAGENAPHHIFSREADGLIELPVASSLKFTRNTFPPGGNREPGKLLLF